MRKLFAIMLLCGYGFVARSQKADVPPLFQQQDPLALQIAFSIREVKKSKVDSVFFHSSIKFKVEDAWDSIPMEIRARGNFRRRNCFFPPLRLRMNKKDSEKTIFEGNKSFKLVLPCQTVKSGWDLIMKEYLCYKLLEPLTPYYFHTRLTYITLTNTSGKNPKPYSVIGFIIEDDDLIAHRFDGKVVEKRIHPLQLNDTAAVVLDLFQYMIANTDWSSYGQHNMKVIRARASNVPLAYDFDMAGLVSAPYATVNENLSIRSVKERLYRGFCRNESVVQYVRSEYIKNEPIIMKVIDDHKSYFTDADFKGIKKFINEFFEGIKNDRSFSDAILFPCRKD
ncbi:MAG: hypothetical protein JNM78_14890 [Cyclobacteriaceae bacterium]|nr:hypothetical protein [Cyclobacteriaceae bacterium]